MIDDFQLFVAGEDATIIDRLGGCLMIPPDDHEGQAMAQRHGYVHCPDSDERYGPALRRAYDELYKIEKGD